MNSGAELNCDSVNLFDKLGNIYILLYALSIRLYFVVPPRIFFSFCVGGGWLDNGNTRRDKCCQYF